MTQRTRKHRPPKHLEKMLFINHKEDILLHDRLEDLTVKSKMKIMEMDLESRRVKTELRTSRKKNIQLATLDDGGIVPTLMRKSNTERNISLDLKVGERRQSAPNVRMNVASHSQRRPSLQNNCVQRRASTAIQFGRQPSIFEVDEIDENEEENGVNKSEEGEIQHRIDISRMDRACAEPQDSVGYYVLREFRRMSQVVPSILRGLSNKEQVDEAETSTPVIPEETINIGAYEPDILKVTALVRSVKQLRHRMSISKKLETCRPQKSLKQMIKDKTESFGDHDEFTDGTCVLMKRRLEKQRRGSEPAVLGAQTVLHRRGSLFAPQEMPTRARWASSAVPMRPLHRSRSASLSQLPTTIQRSASSLGFGTRSNLASTDDGKSQTIDEDELRHRHRVMRELANYEQIREKVEKFIQTKGTTN